MGVTGGPGLDCDGRANHMHDRDMQTAGLSRFATEYCSLGR